MPRPKRKFVAAKSTNSEGMMYGFESRTETKPTRRLMSIKVRSNSWNAQLAIPNDPRYARLDTNLGIGQTKEG
ncbi:hypothetical protein TNCV_77911 [Trichonephila clavipes]|nr:hypothetical protein TNCV_77911 [Trichonephila clavipes]